MELHHRSILAELATIAVLCAGKKKHFLAFPLKNLMAEYALNAASKKRKKKHKFHHVLLHVFCWQWHSKMYVAVTVGITAGVGVSHSLPLLVLSAVL